jgi:hypothetical protein
VIGKPCKVRERTSTRRFGAETCEHNKQQTVITQLEHYARQQRTRTVGQTEGLGIKLLASQVSPIGLNGARCC